MKYDSFSRLVPPTPESFHNAVQNSILEATTMHIKRRHKLSIAILYALLAAFLLSSGVIAAAHLGGAIDWFGNPVETEEDMRDRAADGFDSNGLPPDTDREQLLLALRAEALMLKKPQEERWIIKIPGDIGWEVIGDPRLIIETYEDLFDKIKVLNIELVIPPDRMENLLFKSGSIGFFDTEDTIRNTVLREEEITEDGFVIDKYIVGEGYANNLDQYVMEYGNPTGESFTAWASLQEENDTFTFPLDNVSDYETVSIPGMESGIYLHLPNDTHPHRLYMRKKLVTPVKFATLDWKSDLLQWEYGDVIYIFESNILGKDELIAVAKSMK